MGDKPFVELPPILEEYLADAADVLASLEDEEHTPQDDPDQPGTSRAARRTKADRRAAKLDTKHLNQYFVQGTIRSQLLRALAFLDDNGIAQRAIALEMGYDDSAISHWKDDPPSISAVSLRLFQGLFRKRLQQQPVLPLWVRAFEAYAYSSTRVLREVLRAHPDRDWFQLSAEEYEIVRRILASEAWMEARQSGAADSRLIATRNLLESLCPRMADWLIDKKAITPREFWKFGEALYETWRHAVCIVETDTRPEITDVLYE